MNFKEDLEFSSAPNYLITRRGRTIKCSGGNHVKVCKMEFGSTMKDFLTRLRGCRVKAYKEELAVEYHDNLSQAQRSRINTILKMGKYTRLTTEQHGIKESRRPIRSIE